ncbi:hypothetical protein ABK040_003264 [Willaertia magna]
MKTLVIILLLGLVTGFIHSQSLNDPSLANYFSPYMQESAKVYPIPYLTHQLALFASCIFEGVSVYSPTTYGSFIDNTALKRPVNEHTTVNRNTVMARIIYRLLVDNIPSNKTVYDNLLIKLGMNPNDDSRQVTNPNGMGNLIADTCLNKFRTDRSNRLGDLTSTYFRQNYSDYTGYKPVNDAYRLNDVDRWQPLIVSNQRGLFRVQQFTAPQYGLIPTLSGINVADMKIPAQRDLHSQNQTGYAAKVNEVIDASALLTEKQKLIAEFFDDKFLGFPLMAAFALGQGINDVETFAKFNAIVNVAFMDAMIAMWYWKVKFDAVRPTTAIRFLKENVNIRAYGGPGVGTVLMGGKEWTSYLPTDAFPEYPSGTSCLCSTFGEILTRYLGGNKLNYYYTYKKGSSKFEPGITPSNDLTIGWENISDMVRDCGYSRLWGGVHFSQAIEVALDQCKTIGATTYVKYSNLAPGVR